MNRKRRMGHDRVTLRPTSLNLPLSAQNEGVVRMAGMGWKRVAAISVAVVVGMSSGSTFASASETPDIDPMIINALVSYNPGSKAAEISSAIGAEASRSHKSPAVVARAALAEIKVAFQKPAKVSSRSATPYSGSSGGGTVDAYRNAHQVTLPCSVQGNFFFSDAASYGVKHGHNGIYGLACQSIEAVGGGVPVTRYTLPGHKIYTSSDQPARIQQTAAAYSVAQRHTAAVFASSKNGYAYKDNFAFNRHVQDTSYNCSQLVWAAWMYSTHVDLDKDGGYGVYPTDIRDSARARTIRTL